MSGAGYTPGPWFTGEPHFGRYSIYSEHSAGGVRCRQGRQSICIAHYEGKGGSKTYHDMFKANARLIAAAPELLEALELVVEHWTKQFERGGHLAPEWCKKARSAIAKATGEQQ